MLLYKNKILFIHLYLCNLHISNVAVFPPRPQSLRDQQLWLQLYSRKRKQAFSKTVLFKIFSMVIMAIVFILTFHNYKNNPNLEGFVHTLLIEKPTAFTPCHNNSCPPGKPCIDPLCFCVRPKSPQNDFMSFVNPVSSLDDGCDSPLSLGCDKRCCSAKLPGATVGFSDIDDIDNAGNLNNIVDKDSKKKSSKRKILEENTGVILPEGCFNGTFVQTQKFHDQDITLMAGNLGETTRLQWFSLISVQTMLQLMSTTFIKIKDIPSDLLILSLLMFINFLVGTLGIVLWSAYDVCREDLSQLTCLIVEGIFTHDLAPILLGKDQYIHQYLGWVFVLELLLGVLNLVTYILRKESKAIEKVIIPIQKSIAQYQDAKNVEAIISSQE